MAGISWRVIFTMKYRILLVVFCAFSGLSYAQVAEKDESVIVAPMEVAEPVGVAKFEENGLYGIKDHSTGTVIIPATYRSIEDDSRGRFILIQQDGSRGVFHGRLSKMIVPVEFNSINIHDSDSDYSNDTSFVVTVEKNGRKGLLNHRGNTILELEYDQIRLRWGNSRATVKKGNKEGVYFLNKTGRNIPVEYDDIDDTYPKGYFAGKKNDRYSLFDDKGNQVVSDQSEIATYQDVTRGLTKFIRIVNNEGKYGLYDSEKARPIFPAKYEWIGPSYKDLFIVRQKGRYGLVSNTGKEVSPFLYDTLAFLQSNLAITRLKARQKQRYALITFKNKVLTKFEYDDIEANGPLFTVKVDKGYSIIDSTGTRITASVYDHVGRFYQGKSAVVLHDKTGYINTKGVIISPIDKPRKGSGFRTLDDLFNGLVKALKADNDTVLIAFCRDVVFDEGTGEFMKRLNTSYRGFPEKIGMEKHTIEEIVIRYAKYVRRFQDELRRYNELESLRYIRMRDDQVGYWNEEHRMPGTESPVRLVTNRRNYDFKPGELIYVDGYWKSFTFPEAREVQ
jgi:hypothetical protein